MANENKKNSEVLEKEIDGTNVPGNDVSDKQVNDGYKKLTELTKEDISKLTMYPVEVKHTERATNGDVYHNYSITLKLAPELSLTLTGKKFQASDFYYLQKVIFERLYGMGTRDNYIKSFPVRFFKGTQYNSDGTSYEYYLAQLIIGKGKFYSFYLSKQNCVLDLFNTLVEIGTIKNVEWSFKDIEATKDEDGNDVFILE